MANFPAAQAGLRSSPIDAGNLNRSFPGSARGDGCREPKRRGFRYGGGGGGGITHDALQRTERGLRRILQTLGMLPGYQPDAAQGTREVNARGSVYAYHSGLFEPFKTIGDPVEKDEIVGVVHYPDTPWQAADSVISPYSGMVLSQRALAQVERGDAVFQIAADAVS